MKSRKSEFGREQQEQKKQELKAKIVEVALEIQTLKLFVEEEIKSKLDNKL